MIKNFNAITKLLRGRGGRRRTEKEGKGEGELDETYLGLTRVLVPVLVQMEQLSGGPAVPRESEGLGADQSL